MVTRLLNVCGLYLGPDDDMMPAHAHDNPAGYWENLSFTHLNDEILAALSGSWDDLPDLEPEWWKRPPFDAFRARATALIEDFEQHAPWGWKDPRNCLTLPFWQDIVPDLKVIFCLRNPLEIVWSLSRGGETRSVLAKTALRLWQSYHEQLLNTIRPDHFITTHYASYFYDSQKELRRVLEALDMEVSEEVIQEAIATIKPGLRHAVYGARHLPQKEIPRRTIQLYRMLGDESGAVYQQVLADDAYWVDQLKDNNQKQYTLLMAEADRALRAHKEGEEHKAANERLNESVTRMEGERATLEAETARLVASVNQLESEKAALKAEQEALAESAGRLKSEKAALETERVAFAGSVGHLEGEKAALVEAVGRLERQRAEQEAKSTRLVASVGRLEGEKAVLETERVALAGSVGHLEGEKAAFAESVARLEGEKTALETEQAALKTERAALEAERVMLAGSVGHLEGEKAALAESVARIESQREELEVENTRLVASVGRLEGEKIALETERAALKTERAAFETEWAAFETERAAFETERAAFTESASRLAELEAENTRLVASVGHLEGERAAFETERAALVESVARLERQRAEQEAENARLAAWAGSLENEKSVFKAQRGYLQQERNRMRRSFLVRVVIRLQDLRRISVKRVLKKIIRGGRASSPVHLFLDYPYPYSDPVVGPFYVSGWAFSSAGSIERVEAFLGEELLGTVQYGIDRPDVAAAFSIMENARNSGYEHLFTLNDVQPGEYEFVVRATDAVGNSQSVCRPIVFAASPANVLPVSSSPTGASPVRALPELAPQKEEEQTMDRKKKASFKVDRALWQDGYLDVEGWVMWPKSQPPRMVHVWTGGQLVGTARCNLSRPEINRHFPKDLRPYCQGFRLSKPLSPEAHAGSGGMKVPFVIEVVDKEGQKLRLELALRHEGESSQSKEDEIGIERLLRAFVIDYQTRTGRQPSILDWNTGLQLKQRFPEIAIVSPPMLDKQPLLPYVDKSIDVVFSPSSEPAFLAEAERVATGALLLVNTRANGTSGPQILVKWHPEIEAASALPSASIIIPVYNQAPYTRNCLEQLRRTLPDSFNGEVLVVDDSSTDETPAMLEALAQDWPALGVIRKPENRGFIDSCNQGAQAATGTFLIFLNNDTLPQAGWFVSLLETFERYEDAGAVGGKLIYPDGTLQEAGGIIFSDGSGWNFGRYDPAIDHPLYNHVREVDYCSGALLATRREVFLRLGGFDTRYHPAYYEDTDYCFTLRKEGFHVYYQPESVVIHFEGISSGTDITSGVKRHQALNKQKFVDKWRQALKRQPPPPPKVGLATQSWLVVRDEIEEGEHYAY